MRTLCFALVAAGPLALLAAPASASVIFSDGFESGPLASGAATVGRAGNTTAVPGWTVLRGNAGRYNALGSGRLNYAGGALTPPAGGTTFAYLQWSPASPALLARDAGSIVGGATYTLTAAVGAENQSPVRNNSNGWKMQLVSGGTELARANRTSSGANQPPAGGWTLNTLTWPAPAALDGRPLTVWLAVEFPGPGGYIVANFDSVVLTVTAAAVPAPATVAILAFGVAALAGLGRRGGYRPVG